LVFIPHVTNKRSFAIDHLKITKDALVDFLHRYCY